MKIRSTGKIFGGVCTAQVDRVLEYSASMKNIRLTNVPQNDYQTFCCLTSG